MLVVAIHDNGIVLFRHKPFHRGERLVAKFDGKLKLRQDLGDDAGGLFIWAKQEGLVAHFVIVGTEVGALQVTVVIQGNTFSIGL